MKMLMPFYYQEFKCIGEKCPDSCCKGWRITVDEDSWRRYQTLEGDLGEKLRNSIRLEDGSYAFQL
ncbi:MAG: flagellar protein FliB, partial [Acetivibrio ethanolgignens]